MKKLLVFVVVLLAPVAIAAPSIRFSSNTVTIDGITRGGSAAVFSVALEPIGVPPTPARTSEALLIRDDDKDGVVSFTRAMTIPPISVWIVIDYETGERAVTGGPGYQPITFQAGEVAKRDNAGQLRKLSASLGEIECMVVRPNVGAWSVYAAKSSRLDESQRGEPLRIDIGSMQPVGSSPAAPNSFHKGDIVAFVDPYTMRFYVTEVGQ